MFGTGLDMLNQDICLLHNSIAVYNSYGGIVFAAEEGRNIARALGPKNKVSFLDFHQMYIADIPDCDSAQSWALIDRQYRR